MNPAEFPHSEISGSMDVCSSPKLIAAYHVFHRLPVPRHSPCALCSLTVQMLSHLFLFQILHLPTRFYRLVKLYCLQLYHGFNILLSNLRSSVPLGEIIDFIKNQEFYIANKISFCSSIFSFQGTSSAFALHRQETNLLISSGGLKWTRTIDLSVISRVL